MQSPWHTPFATLNTRLTEYKVDTHLEAMALFTTAPNVGQKNNNYVTDGQSGVRGRLLVSVGRDGLDAVYLFSDFHVMEVGLQGGSVGRWCGTCWGTLSSVLSSEGVLGFPWDSGVVFLTSACLSVCLACNLLFPSMQCVSIIVKAPARAIKTPPSLQSSELQQPIFLVAIQPQIFTTVIQMREYSSLRDEAKSCAQGTVLMEGMSRREDGEVEEKCEL